MIYLDMARIIADVAIFFELVDDEILDPDVCVEQMESIGYNLQQMKPEDLRELINAFPVVAAEYEGKIAEMVRDIPYSFFLEEHLAGDDPEELARLEAIRDARDD